MYIYIYICMCTTYIYIYIYIYVYNLQSRAEHPPPSTTSCSLFAEHALTRALNKVGHSKPFSNRRKW